MVKQNVLKHGSKFLFVIYSVEAIKTKAMAHRKMAYLAHVCHANMKIVVQMCMHTQHMNFILKAAHTSRADTKTKRCFCHFVHEHGTLVQPYRAMSMFTFKPN